jgi:hypothetical protein
VVIVQKMELGVLVWDCGCLARDLKRIFTTYWNLSRLQQLDDDRLPPQSHVHIDHTALAPTVYNMHHPLTILHKGQLTDVYLAVSSKRG